MANTSFFGLTGTTAEVQNTIQASVDAAATSATNSATSETNSATSETNSAASAASALTSKNAAAVSAAAALVSENAAAASAVAAASSAAAVTGASASVLQKTGGAMTGAITTNSTFDGRDVATDGAKLDGIESGATADQTAAEIKTSYESNSDTNAFTDALQSKLNAVEASADVTDAGNVNPLVDAHLNQSTAASGEVLSWNGSDYDWIAAASGGGDLLAANNLSDVASAGIARSNLGVAIGSDVQAHSSVLDSTTASFTTAKDSKLTGIEAGATADQTGAEIKAAYENNSNTNAFTDAEKTKLTGIAAGANNYVHPNHTGEVTSTADGATVIADNVVDEANLKVSNAPTNGYFLSAQSGAAGGLTWAAVSGGGGGGDLLAANNLSDVASAGTARTNLGLGTAATTASTDYATAAQGTLASSALQSGDNVSLLTNNAGYLTSVPAQSFSSLTGKPTTISGYGITDVNSNIDTHLNTSTASASEVLSWNGSDYDWVAQSGGGGGASLDLYAENPSTPTNPTAGGNNSVAIGNNATVTTAGSGSTGDKSIAIGHNSSVTNNNAIGAGRQATVSGSYASGFGYLATSAGTQSHATTNSYASGTNSFAAAIVNNTSSYGATGNNSIAIGQLSKSTQTNGVAIGKQCSSLAQDSVVIGNANSVYSSKGVTIGSSNNVLASNGIGIGTNTYVSSGATYGMAFGFQSRAFQQSQFSFAAGNFASLGDAQGSMYILRCATTDATPTVLTTNAGASANFNQIEVQTDQCLTFDGTITAMQNGAQSYASWRVEGLLVNDGGTTTVANSAITVIDNQSSWGLTLTADTGNNCLAITFTGEAAHNIRTVANIRTSEVTYA